MGVTAPRNLGWHVGWTLAGFVPYVAVTAVQLASKFRHDVQADHVSKALEMPTLAFGVGVAMLLAHRRPRPRVTALLFAGLALSWFGDIFIARLPVGLGLFFFAHAAYIWMFEVAFHNRLPSRWGLLAIPWFVALLGVLTPRLGGMLLCFTLYGLILAAMTVSSTRGNRWTAAGGVLFLLSDSVLSLRLFTRFFRGSVGSFAIMLSYTAAQAFISVGILRDKPAT